MTLRVVSETELREALRGGEYLARGREHVLTELAALRDWLLWKAGENVGFSTEFAELLAEDGERYPLELLDEIVREIKTWPQPLTIDDLREEGKR